MSFILFFGTYTCSMALKKFKTSRYFPTTVSMSFHPSRLFSLLFQSVKLSYRWGQTLCREDSLVLVNQGRYVLGLLGFTLSVFLEGTGKAAKEPK